MTIRQLRCQSAKLLSICFQFTYFH